MRMGSCRELAGENCIEDRYIFLDCILETNDCAGNSQLHSMSDE